MSTQAISDYLAKQIFIEKNIVSIPQTPFHLSHRHPSGNIPPVEQTVFVARQYGQKVKAFRDILCGTSGLIVLLSELATYHHNAPYQSQSCSATFLISGVFGKRNAKRNDEDNDYNMDQTPVTEDCEDAEEGDEEDDSEGVVETCMTLVNEKDLEGAFDHDILLSST